MIVSLGGSQLFIPLMQEEQGTVLLLNQKFDSFFPILQRTNAERRISLYIKYRVHLARGCYFVVCEVRL
jgi:hypothetical protein